MKAWSHRLYLLLAGLTGLALFLMMLLGFADVVTRKLSTMDWAIALGVRPLRGAVELAELFMVVVVFAGLPLVSLRGEHVTFELVDRYVPARWRRASVRAMHAVCALVFAALAAMMVQKAGRLAEDGQTTAQLAIAMAPFAYLMGVMLGLTALVHAALAVLAVDRVEQASPTEDVGGLE